MNKELEKLFNKYPIYSQEKVTPLDKVVIAKYFSIASNHNWYITEASKQEDGDWLMFGFTSQNTYDDELGYISLSELESIKLIGNCLAIERDLHFDDGKITLENALKDDNRDIPAYWYNLKRKNEVAKIVEKYQDAKIDIWWGDAGVSNYSLKDCPECESLGKDKTIYGLLDVSLDASWGCLTFDNNNKQDFKQVCLGVEINVNNQPIDKQEKEKLVDYWLNEQDGYLGLDNCKENNFGKGGR